MKKKNLSFTYEDWVEIHCALNSKASAIKSGLYGPEIKQGENRRWLKDLRRIQGVIEKAGLS